MAIFKRTSSPHTIVWSLLAAVLVVSILFFGLRTNRSKSISLLPVKGAFAFEKYVTAYSKDMTHLRKAALSSELTIALVAQAGSLAQNRFRSILMFHDGKDEHQLIVGQWGDALIVMNGDDYDYTQRRPRLARRRALSETKARFITVTADRAGSCLYIDGAMVHKIKGWQLMVPRSGAQLRMVIGNSVSGKHSWAGSFYGLAIYAKAQSSEAIEHHYHQWQNTTRFPYDTGKHLIAAYDFTSHRASQVQDLSGNRQQLGLADHTLVLKKSYLKPPWRDFMPNRAFYFDVLLNFAGFIPLGAVLFIWFKSFLLLADKPLALAVIGICFLLSLGIEISQAWLPTRDSNLLDLVLNTCGGWAGLWLPKIGSALRYRCSP